jgi:signal transduction histidine kinase
MGNKAVILWTLNMELEITYVSDSIQALSGCSVDEYMALPTLDAVAEKSQEAATKKMFADYLALEARGKPFMGTESICLFRLRKDGLAQGVVGFTVDVSDIIHPQARRELLEQQVQILRQKEIISLVAGGIAHDFNNSLQAIMGFAELVLDRSNTDALPKDVVELQSQILKSAGSAADLVKKLLALSSQQTLSRKRVNVKVWLQDCVPMANSILGSSVELQIIAVDTGSGIPESDLDRISDPFFSLKDSEKGPGLGLAVTLGIVDQHEGHIRAANLDSGGKCF